jgi:BirA family biotin operon repressor/biotin-[acetyl-CoA-carboxylase] ligase
VSFRSDFLEHSRRLATAARPAVENVLVQRRIDSTHACALRLIEQAETEEIVLPETLIVAIEQDQGRGRAGRDWISPVGGLYLSWIAAGLDLRTISRLPMIAAAAAHEAIGGLGVGNLVIKWPNDLLIAGHKLAGLLVHARHGAVSWATVGLGVNLKRAPEIPGDGSPEPTSVADHLSGDSERGLTERLVGAFVRSLADGIQDPRPKLDLWRDRLAHEAGDDMVVRTADGFELRGTFAGLTDEGHLRLDCADGEHTVTTGDVVE